ncbi:hypothetical protein A2Z00_01780 [Candidatus Gottesmanbacteria bacterium RBG_13_45_10]|uniref:Phosphatidic acid phosphatase type 2/haloperoxidase domain-containing protein n=1 Tax=Candidatus Gottesmanbacteria bacterium RBG_13_45_10 TaxID=1798370 RepID=A0A1F5ZHC1_9BACT|nr:MAG: hypothetical protein A2Z00_01780 [Candidatus Gottesmanbacteria bacterium RBG_13_45_10]
MEFIRKHPRILLAFCGGLLLACFYFFSREVKRGFLKQADFDTTVRLQDKMPSSASRIDEMWEDVAFFVTPGPSMAIIIVITIITIIKEKTAKRRLASLAIPVLFGLLILGEIYGKNVVHHPSPPFFMIKNPTTIFPKYYINEAYSYPSGHAARAAFLGFSFLSLITYRLSLSKKNLKKWIVVGALTFLFVAIVAIGRIYLGHHWLSDVIGGGLVGSALGIFSLVVR